MIIREKADIDRALAFLDNCDLTCFDIETNSLNPRTGKLIGFGVANANTLKAFYIVMREWKNNQLVTLLTEADVEPVLQKLQGKRLITHNGAFDTIFTLHQTKVNLINSIYCDTMLAAHLVDENKFNYGLKELSSTLFGVDAKKEQETLKESIKMNGGKAGELYKADSQIIAEYGIKDVILTAKNYNHWNMALAKQGLTNFFYTDETMPLYREVTIPMELRGVRMDVAKIATAMKDISTDLLKLEDDIQSQIATHLGIFTEWFLNKDYALKTHTGKVPAWSKKYATQYDAWRAENEGYMFNLLSKHHLKKLFFDTLGETPLSKTPTGLGQVDEEFIESLSSKYEWCQKLIVYNKLTKIKGTYIERFLNEIEGGIFYPRFHQHRTVSGRYAGDLQQLPRPLESGDPLVMKYTNLIREFIIARPGCKLISCDYEQLEPTVFAHTSQDSALQAIFNNGVDFYSEVAIRTERLEGVSSDKKGSNYLGKVDKVKRQKAKAYSLGIAYGMTGYKLQFEIGVSQEEAEQLVRDYLNAFPGLNAWINKSHDEARLNGFVRTETGRIRHMPKAKQLHEKYGPMLLDSLALWKLYNTVPSVYQQAKEDRGVMKNLLNNAVNVKVQGLAASIVNRASIAIARAKLPCNILGQVHDELIFECAEADVETVCKAVKEIMENNYTITTPLKTVPQVGTNYRECK